MKKTMFRTSLIVALVLALVGLTVSSFAYWDQLTTKDSREITISEGAVISINQQVNPTEKLIPVEAVLGEGETHEVTFTYDVKLSKKAVNDLILNVTLTNKTIDGSTEHADLVNVEINPLTSTVNQEGTQVVVKVTLTMPENNLQYEAIKNKAIAFELTFSATQA